MMKKIFLFLIAAPALALLLTCCFVYYLFQYWTYKGPDVYFEVHPGEHFAQINHRLSQEKIISSAKIFHRYVKYKNALTKLQIGTFQIKTGSNMPTVFKVLTQSKPLMTKITIPEGKNLYEIGKILENQQVVSYDDFVRWAKDESFMQEIGVNQETAEGYLYPDTYFFPPQTTAKKVIEHMVKVFFHKTRDVDFNHPELSPHQIVILASMVEKETGAKQERKLIAGVFLNRLKKKMRLQSDPTTIYGIYENFRGNLTKNDLLAETPYNTYKISALPIGPIANPGLLSIEAVLNPEQHNYLYFVSKNDGTHFFSSTYQEHQRGVEHFQKNRANRIGKSWRDLKEK